MFNQMNRGMCMFKVTGVSTFKGEVKVRFANDLTRVKLLQKAENTDIQLIEMPEPKSKLDCALFLKQSDLYANPKYATAIDAAIEKYSLPETTASKKKTPVKQKQTPSLDAIRSRIKAAPQKESDVVPDPALV